MNFQIFIQHFEPSLVTQIGRNITRMNICVREFFKAKPQTADFLLYIGKVL